jgi:fermentation-respiration switch protein FrsA (DUF1100 family)
MMRWLENRLVFRPARAEDWWVEPSDLPIQNVRLTSTIGTLIHAWFLPHEANTGAVLVSHGNGGNLSHRVNLIEALHHSLGRSILIYDYPGYGHSGGKPSEAGCYAAGEAALQWLTGQARVPARQVVLLGESLGSGVAVELARRWEHEALVLLFPFTSLPAVARHHYPWLPANVLMSNRFDNLSKIGGCRQPVFITHGTADQLVPFHQGETLFAAAHEPKRFLPLEGHSHNLWVGELFFRELRRFLDEQRSRSA